jgi:hypothetical protein
MTSDRSYRPSMTLRCLRRARALRGYTVRRARRTSAAGAARGRGGAHREGARAALIRRACRARTSV